SVTNGLFTVLIDFGPGVFSGQSNWLEIAVETNGVTTFTTLSPRQELTPVPYAIFAEGASNVTGTVNGSAIAPGTVTATQIAPGTITTMQIASNQVVTSLNALRNAVI